MLLFSIFIFFGIRNELWGDFNDFIYLFFIVFILWYFFMVETWLWDCETRVVLLILMEHFLISFAK